MPPVKKKFISKSQHGTTYRISLPAGYEIDTTKIKNLDGVALKAYADAIDKHHEVARSIIEKRIIAINEELSDLRGDVGVSITYTNTVETRAAEYATKLIIISWFVFGAGCLLYSYIKR